MELFEDFTYNQQDVITEQDNGVEYNISPENKLYLNSVSLDEAKYELKQINEKFYYKLNMNFIEKDENGFFVQLDENILDVVKAGLATAKSASMNVKTNYKANLEKVQRNKELNIITSLLQNIQNEISGKLFNKIGTTKFNVVTKPEIVAILNTFYNSELKMMFSDKSYTRMGMLSM